MSTLNSNQIQLTFSYIPDNDNNHNNKPDANTV